MTAFSYPAKFREVAAGFVVSFPDFPLCQESHGFNYAQAQTLAAETLVGHMTMLHEQGRPIPVPTGVDDVVSLMGETVSLLTVEWSEPLHLNPLQWGRPKRR